MLALQSVISPFPPILLHHSNPNILSSVTQPCSVPGFFWGLPLHLVPAASFSSGIHAQGSRGCSVEQTALAFGGTGLQEEFAACSSCLSLSSRLRKSHCPAWKQIPAALGGSSYQLLLSFSWHPPASGKEKPGMAPCEDCQTLTSTFPWSSFPGSLRSFLTCLAQADAVTSCGRSHRPMLVLICGKRKSMAASYFLEAIVLIHKACLQRLVFLNYAGESSRKPFFSIIQARFFLPALNTHVDFSVTFTVGVSLDDVLDFLLLS